MGIAKGTIKLMMKEGKQRPFTGSLLTLGRQSVWVTEKQLNEIASEMNYQLVKKIPLELSDLPHSKKKPFISDRFLYRSLGFTEVKSLDYSDYENADIIADLNCHDVLKIVGRQFDFILDGGTIEHVFHIPQALANIFDLLHIGGRIMHVSPSSNHMDHGFYMFSPTLFFDYYQANQFEMNNIQVFRYCPKHDTYPWKVSDYQSGCLEKISFGGLDDAMYGISCIATKTVNSTAHMIPQQGRYRKTWEGKQENKKDSFKDKIPKPIKLPLQKLKHLLSKKGLRLKVVDRY